VHHAPEGKKVHIIILALRRWEEISS